MLTTVFSSNEDGKKDSLRRKYPVFCATGLKPYMVNTSKSRGFLLFFVVVIAVLFLVYGGGWEGMRKEVRTTLVS